MKLECVISYIKKELGIKEWTQLLGIRADEPKRYYGNLTSDTAKQKTEMPLFDRGIDLEKVDEFWRAQNFELNIPHFLGNCVNCQFENEIQDGESMCSVSGVIPQIGDLRECLFYAF